MKNKKGLPLMMAGLLLVAAALCLCGYNIDISQDIFVKIISDDVAENRKFDAVMEEFR